MDGGSLPHGMFVPCLPIEKKGRIEITPSPVHSPDLKSPEGKINRQRQGVSIRWVPERPGDQVTKAVESAEN